jgi:hypothetical protein
VRSPIQPTVLDKTIVASILSTIEPSGRQGSDSKGYGSKLVSSSAGFRLQRTIHNFSFNDAFRPIHINVKFGRTAAHPSVLSFCLPQIVSRSPRRGFPEKVMAGKRQAGNDETWPNRRNIPDVASRQHSRSTIRKSRSEANPVGKKNRIDNAQCRVGLLSPA